MKRLAAMVLIVLSFALVGCGGSHDTTMPQSTKQLALLTADDNQQNLAVYEWDELQRVLEWMNTDIMDTLRAQDYTVVELEDMKDYQSTLGALLIINVEYFYGGDFEGRPRRDPATGPSSLELSYKILDERGALLAGWQDGVNSIKGGTYCAETLNRRLSKRLPQILSSTASAGN